MMSTRARRPRWAWSRPAATMPRPWARPGARGQNIRSIRCCSARAAKVQETGAANFLLLRDGATPDARPRQHVSARRDARFPADAGARSGLCRVGARVRRERNAGVGENRRSRSVGDGGGAGRRGHPDLSRRRTPGRRRRGGPAHARACAAQLVAIQQGEAPDRTAGSSACEPPITGPCRERLLVLLAILVVVVVQILIILIVCLLLRPMSSSSSSSALFSAFEPDQPSGSSLSSRSSSAQPSTSSSSMSPSRC